MSKQSEGPYAVPAAIVVAGLLIAMALGSRGQAAAAPSPAAPAVAPGSGCGI